MQKLILAVVALAGCRESSAAVVAMAGPPNVAIESITLTPRVGEAWVDIGLKNTGGGGLYYVLFLNRATPNNPEGPAYHTEPAAVAAGDRAIVRFTTPFERVTIVLVYARAENSQVYTSRDCYLLAEQAHC